MGDLFLKDFAASFVERKVLTAVVMITTSLMLVPYLPYISTLKMEAIYTSATLTFIGLYGVISRRTTHQLCLYLYIVTCSPIARERVTNAFPWRWIFRNQLVTAHVSVDTNHQQTFPWIRIRCIRREQNWFQNRDNPCGGVAEYLHRSPASLRRRRKGNPVPGGITGPPCSWGMYVWGPGPPGWRSLESQTVKCGHESRGTRT
jgi:hypothetical protein